MANGLVDQAEQIAPISKGDPAAIPDENGMVQGSPEDQEAIDAALDYVAMIVYEKDETSGKIVKQLTNAGEENVVEVIAQTANMLIASVEDQFEGLLPEKIIIPLGDIIAKMLIDLGTQAGAFKLSEDQIIKARGTVVKLLYDTYGVSKEAMQGVTQGVTQEDLQGAAEMFGDIATPNLMNQQAPAPTAGGPAPGGPPPVAPAPIAGAAPGGTPPVAGAPPGMPPGV